MDGDKGLRNIFYNGTGGLVVELCGNTKILMEIKWKDYFNCGRDLLLPGASLGGIRSFCYLFNDKKSENHLHALFQFLHGYVDGDPTQIGWLSSEYHNRLSTLRESVNKKLSQKKGNVKNLPLRLMVIDTMISIHISIQHFRKL